MTQEQAKLILASYRPNGADDSDPAFQEALQLAADNGELGSWLAREKARDSAFADMLADLAIPEDLRDSVFNVLAAEIDSPGYDDFDQTFVDALVGVSPPDGLRAEILAAMEVETKIAQLPQEKSPSNGWQKVLQLKPIVTAAAAGLVLALLWSYMQHPETAGEQANAEEAPLTDTLSSSSVEESSIAYLKDAITLDLYDKRQEALYHYLASGDLPVPEVLPEGLRDVPGMGCRKMNFKGKEGSLICFQVDPDQPLVHLVVMRRKDLEGQFPELAGASENSQKSLESGWSVAKWQDEDRAFFLMSHVDPSQLAALF